MNTIPRKFCVKMSKIVMPIETGDHTGNSLTNRTAGNYNSDYRNAEGTVCPERKKDE